jgi:hypothetical protein
MGNRILYANRPSIEEYAKYPLWADEHWTLYEHTENLPKIRNNNPHLGFVYVVEYGDMVKIGFTVDARERFAVKYKPAQKLGYERGRCFLSPAHTNYLSTERTLHKHFAEYRAPNTELFRIKFNENIPTMMCMVLEQTMYGRDEININNNTLEVW